MHKTSDLWKTINHYDFFVDGIKNNIFACRERNSMGLMIASKLTYKARRKVDDILRECFEYIFGRYVSIR